MSYLKPEDIIDIKKDEINKLRKERRIHYLKFNMLNNLDENARLTFSLDPYKIPYYGDSEHEFLITGKKCYETFESNEEKPINWYIQDKNNPDYNHIYFYRDRTREENDFMKDYNKLIGYKTAASIKKFVPKTNNKFTIEIFKKLKVSLLNELSEQTQFKEDKQAKRRIINFKLDNNGYPYRSYNKLKSLYDDFDKLKYKQNIKHYNDFDVKESKNKYSLKTYSNVKNSFIGDIFFESNISAFLLLININTRFAYAYQLGDVEIKETINVDNNTKEYEMKYQTNGKKTIEELKKAFNKHLKISKVNILRFDGERAISSKDFKDYLKQRNIKFYEAKTEAHSSLSLIDRLCRTIRDIAFNLNFEGIYSQEIMDKILNYYNTSRHETLTQTLFKAYPDLKLIYNYISPYIMEHNNNNLETLFVKECIKYNYYIKQKPDFKLNNNEVVKVVNNNEKLKKKRTILNKDDFKIIKQRGNIFELQNVNNENIKTYKPRYQIKPLTLKPLDLTNFETYFNLY